MTEPRNDATQDRLRGSEYDGIAEYDNDLPQWWLWIFYVTLVFGFVYWAHYFILQTGQTQEAEMQEVAAVHQARYAPGTGAAKAEATDDGLRTASKDPSVLADGTKVFMTYCVQCHGKLGEGGIGPNLTDDHWIHGGTPFAILATIRNGVPEKGMIPWKSMLTGRQMETAAAYILTLKGTNPPNGKAPQGQKE
jgi:cytochrome c oxidase cbb3-type subunit 3